MTEPTRPRDDGFCAWCPRLCRHVCPVAVGTAWESATPSAIRGLLLAAAGGAADLGDAQAAASLCNGCGACTAHCKHHEPVADRLRAWRAEAEGRPPAEPLAPIHGDARHVCILTTGRDWSEAWSRRSGLPAAALRTGDALGHARWLSGDVELPERLRRHLAGRVAVVASGAAAQVLQAAGVERVELPAPAGREVYTTCFEGPKPGPTQLACCGQREGFARREPHAAALVAEENVRLAGGRPLAVADEQCACWLRAHGAEIVDPVDDLMETAR